MINRDEYVAGTNPQDPQSFLKLDAGGIVPEGGAVLSFQAVSNRSYSVQFRNALGTGDWLRVTNISPTTNDRTIMLTNPAPGIAERFYRLVTPQQSSP
jgi:hypothetical protein